MTRISPNPNADIDWEYPGGNGADYKQIPNSKKKGEIAAYPRLLKELKKAIGTKELSITVPGLERDMIAFTSAESPKINAAVDFVTVRGSRVNTKHDLVVLETDQFTFRLWHMT